MNFSKMHHDELYRMESLLDSKDEKVVEKFVLAIISNDNVEIAIEKNWPSDAYAKKFLDKLYLVANRCKINLYNLGLTCSLIGEYWTDDRYDSRVLDMLIESKNHEWITWAGANWPDDRYDDRILEHVLNSSSMYSIRHIVTQWPKKRFDYRAVDYVLQYGEWNDL